MKNILFNLFLFAAFACSIPSVHAQSASDEASVKAFFKEVSASYQEGDDEKIASYYSDDVQEIGVDGKILIGKKQIKETWNAFMKMLDAPPVFHSSAPIIRFITPDVATIIYNSEADLKIGGQQVGGKSADMVLVHRVNGRWLIEFDSMTPVSDMNAPGN